MPKETIGSPDEPYQVKVGWGAGSNVQVGIEVPGERSLFWQLLGDQETLVRLGVAVKTIAQDHPDDHGVEQRGRAVLNLLDVASHGCYRGVWAHPTRQECNELIRVLRRARDSAYGRDE